LAFENTWKIIEQAIEKPINLMTDASGIGLEASLIDPQGAKDSWRRK
jgi:hypothetical protein